MFAIGKILDLCANIYLKLRCLQYELLRYTSNKNFILSFHIVISYCHLNDYFVIYYFVFFDCIIGHNYHGHYLHAVGLSVNNYVRENKVREVRKNIGQF